jgi:gamma-butyrobetaine dioxygenase
MQVSTDGARLHLAWPDGHRGSFHAVWLRDNCPCASCRHASGQRLLDSVAIPDGLAVTAAAASDGTIVVSFSDGHTSDFEDGWLRRNCYCGDVHEPRRRRQLWDAGVAGELPVGRFDQVSAGGEPLRRWLAAVDELGFAVLTGGPAEPGTVTAVAELFGHVRETNYGRLFDVRAVVEPSNLAYTGLGLGAHTDNPYRDPTPTLQLLHCLRSSAGGGETTLVDGFRVAEDLRAAEPAKFELLARHPLRFRYADEQTELEAERPVLSLDIHGELEAVHFNTRSAAPLRIDPALVEPYYDAYRTFGRMLASPRYVVAFKLEPGDLFVVDNVRVLHGRTAYSDAGERHLQGCYADRDGLRSTLAVLSRSLIDDIFRVMRERGARQYLGEPVSLAEHMLQSAHAAEVDGASPTVVAAALLHDYGHLVHEGPEDAADHGIDTRHEEVAFAFLGGCFGPAVAEPIRMHVAAKRYLCAVDPAYLNELSPASLQSLELQGGPLSPAEVAAFESSPYADDAVRLRRYDDIGKEPGLATAGLEHYRPLLESLLTR